MNSKSLKKLSFLIVDDQERIRIGISSLLEILCEPREVEMACDGQEAVDMAAKKDYDIIFMDISMPVMDGITAANEIMNNKKANIVAVSMHSDKKDIMRMKEAGAMGYILKDRLGEKMLPAIESVMNGHVFFDGLDVV